MGGGMKLFGLGLAVDDVVQRLADHRFWHTHAFGQVADLGDAPAPEVGHAPMTNLALAQQVAHRGNSDLQWCAVVFAVQVIDVQVIAAQARQAGVDGVEDVLAAQTAAVRNAIGRAKADLAGQDPVMAIAGNGFTYDLFTASGVVHVSGVDEVDALVPGFVDNAQ
ncbi:hypothetical protein D3C79_576710 [compost metagenome]